MSGYEQFGRRRRPGESGQLRIGDAERDAAVSALGEHFAAGRLDEEEHSQRVDGAYAARTRADLDALFSDLPHPEGEQRAAGLDERPWGQRAWGQEPCGPAPWGRRGTFPVGAVLLIIVAGMIFGAITHIPPFFVFPLLVLVVLWRLGGFGGRRAASVRSSRSRWDRG